MASMFWRMTFWQNAWNVQMEAPDSRTIWRSSQAAVSRSSVSKSFFCKALSMRSRISVAAAFVNVTTSISSTLHSRARSCAMMRSTSTRVLPEPAAAATRMLRWRASIAFF